MNVKRSLLILSFLLALAVRVHADTLQELEGELLQNNPEIIAARNRYLAAARLPIQEGTLPDPMVTFTDFGTGHPFSGLKDSDFAYLGFGFSQ